MKTLIALTIILIAAVATAGDDYNFILEKYKYDDADTSNQQIQQPQTQESPTVIQNQWDNKGRHYAPAAGKKNAWRSDGVFMIKVSGGYINSKTGQFVPGN